MATEVSRGTAPTSPPEPSQHQNGGDNGPAEDETEQAKPGFLNKLGLDVPSLVLMFKGSVAPTIALAMLQAPRVSAKFVNLGYLIPIVATINLAFLPRGRYMQMLFLNLLTVGVAAAMALLVYWSTLQARLHTLTAPDPPQTAQHPLVAYNTSQAAVAGVWLFFNTWLLNVVRAKMPAFNIPSIMYSIFLNISCIYAPSAGSMAFAYNQVKELLEAMLTAMALSTAASLIIIPISSRTVVFSQLKQYMQGLQASFKAQGKYMHSLETEDMFSAPPKEEDSKAQNGSEQKDEKASSDQTLTEEAKALKENGRKLMELYGKLQSDMAYVSRDSIWGKLRAQDLQAFRLLLRGIAAPVIGLASITDIFERIGKGRGWIVDDDTPAETVTEKEKEKAAWNEMMVLLHEPWGVLSTAMHEGIEHAGILLEILPAPKEKASKKQKGPDVEAPKDNTLKPGDPGFSALLTERLEHLHDRRGELIGLWLKDSTEMGQIPAESEDPVEREKAHTTKMRRRIQLYVLLYMIKLMHVASLAVQEIVAFADKKVEDGTMSHSRILLPSFGHLGEWFASVFTHDEGTADRTANLFDAQLNTVYLGDGFNRKKDPEHLPPSSLRERAGDALRKVPHLFGSDESAFAFRAACATMSVGIVAFIENTRLFFIEQRLVWAMIIIAIGMTMTSGQSIFGFVSRIGGTVGAVVASFVAWYIVDGRTAGVIVFAWLFLFLGFGVLLKFQRMAAIWITVLVTMLLVLGYELQVRRLGPEVSAATGQPVYPIYELAPYRLATITAGCLVAFIWTVFPSSLSDRRWLRRDLSTALYLLANYVSVVNRSLKNKLLHDGGDEDAPNTPAHKLKEIRTDIFGKLMVILPSLRDHADWQKWEPDVGGKFPRSVYEEIIMRCTRITQYLALMAHTLSWPGPKTGDDTVWLETLSTVLTELTPTEVSVVSTLTLLSNSMLSGHSLPPAMRLPRPYELSRRVDGRRARLLSRDNAEQRGYADFAVLQVSAGLVYDDIEGVVRLVEKLVGVVDFSFRMGASSSSLVAGGSEDGQGDRGKGKVD